MTVSENYKRMAIIPVLQIFITVQAVKIKDVKKKKKKKHLEIYVYNGAKKCIFQFLRI